MEIDMQDTRLPIRGGHRGTAATLGEMPQHIGLFAQAPACTRLAARMRGLFSMDFFPYPKTGTARALSGHTPPTGQPSSKESALKSYSSLAFQVVTAFTMSALALGGAYAAGGAGGGGGVGGGGGGKMQIATTHGITVIEHANPGEASMTGLVQAALAGSRMTPADTVVMLNGVRLVHAPGLAPAYFQVDPAGEQPMVGADGFLHITASSASTQTSRALDLQCPAHIPVTTTPAEGASLSGVPSVELAWSTPLPQSATAVLTFFDPANALLASYDVVSGQVTGGISFQTLFQSASGASLPVQPTNSTGYIAKFTYPGVYLLDGNSGGVCGVEERFVFSQ
jgi:hypothetical protein